MSVAVVLQSFFQLMHRKITVTPEEVFSDFSEMKTRVRDFFQNEMVKFRILFSKKLNCLHLGLDQSLQNDVVLDDLAWFFQVDKTTLFYRFPCRLVFAMYEAN